MSDAVRISELPTNAASRVLSFMMVLWALGFAPALALDPDRPITQFGLQTWTARTGLPGEAVHEITQTSDGYLWVRTNAGVSRFDGARFTPLELRVQGEFVRETPRSLCRAAAGHPLIRTPTRTLRFQNGELSDLLPPGAVPCGVARTLFETRGGEIWVGSDCALHVANHRTLVEAATNTGQVYAFLEDPRGGVWAGTSAGLYRFRNGQPDLKPADFAPIGDVRALAQDRDGSLWVGTSGGLFRLTEGHEPEYIHAHGIAGSLVSALLADRDGSLWAGTSTGGLFRMVGSAWQGLTVTGGLASNVILSLCEDREGSVWVGTDSGLHQLRDTKLITILATDGLPQNDTYSLIEARDGTIYVSTAGGLGRIRDGEVTSFTIEDGLPHNYCTTLYEARDGTIWIGTAVGLARLKHGHIDAYTGEGSLHNPCISAISEDREGLVIATRTTPLLRLKPRGDDEADVDDRAFSIDPRTRELSYIFALHTDSRGTLWYGTVDGLYQAPGGDPSAIAKVEEVAFPVTSIWDDGEGSLWLAGRTPGVTRYRIADGRTTLYTAANGLFDDEVTRVIRDAAGDLWASTGRGIFRVSRHDLDEFAEGRISGVRSVAYGTADGMRSTECNAPEQQPAGWSAHDGRIWFTTRKGVVVIDPNEIRTNEHVPPVIIEELTADGHQFAATSNARLPPGTSRLEFHYTALSLRVPDRVRFRYRLEGFDPQWVDAGNQRVAYYTNVPPGRYRFHVAASNDDGVWNRSGASADIYLAPTFYQTAWFWGLCVAVACTGAGGLIQLRRASVLARERELVRRVDEATRELRDSEDRYRHLFYSNPNPMAVIDTETHAFQAVNDAAVAHYGYTCEEFLAMKETDILAPDELPRLFARRKERRRQPRNHAVRWRHAKKDGTIIDVEVTSSVISFAGRRARIVLAQDVTEKRRAEAQLEYQATHDALTGLTNRAFLLDHLDRLIRASKSSGEPFALLLVDLDRFKDINDTLGHAYGDTVLRQVGARFGAAVRETDVLARLGGDEFAIVLPGVTAIGGMQSAARLQAALNDPFVLDGRHVDVGASIGVAAFAEHGEDPAELLRLADVAMYSAKRSRDGIVIYSPENDSNSVHRLSRAGELRAGIANDELVLFYQPIFDLGTGRAHSAEALIRWEHPRDGLLSPAEFLPVAEHTGVIKALSHWVLSTALVQARVWRESGLDLNVAVNLTSLDVQDPALVETIRRALESANASPSWLTVEVTESMMMEDPGRARAVLGELRSLNIRVAIDDFGVGYSSLSYVRDLPVDELKIDRSFVNALSTDPRTAVIVRSIIELGHGLGLRVVAEGVGDRETRDLLEALGCDRIQGYLMCRPLPAGPFTQWARQTDRNRQGGVLVDPFQGFAVSLTPYTG